MKQWKLDKGSEFELEQSVNTENSGFDNQLMQEINKLIFVQDFEAAQNKLKELIKNEPANHEAYFRLIEVAWKTGSLEEVMQGLEKNSKEVACAMALALGEIRLLEQQAALTQSNGTVLLNPSFTKDEQDYEVVGLSGQSEILGHMSGKKLLVDTSAYQYPTVDPVHRVSRNPGVADDYVATEPMLQPEMWADSPIVEEDFQMSNPEHALVIKAKNFTKQYPNNYAAWFLVGCALEFSGNLNEAISVWIKAISLEPNSMCLLSTLAELQQMGVIPQSNVDYSEAFENLDKFLVHGSLETHVLLFQEYMLKSEFPHAIAALRTLADWMQRQRGEVPAEIEALCLLGAKSAYEKMNNSQAAEACKNEAENLVFATRAAPRNSAQIKFLGEICQEFGLESIARSCYATAISMSDSKPSEVVQCVSQCSNIGCNQAITEALKHAYSVHHGAAEIRFAQVICGAALASISLKDYTDRKNAIRELIQKNDLVTAFPLLQQAEKELDDDAEVHYYLGEILSRFGADPQALEHFQKMQRLDPYNIESTIRYCYFLLRTNAYIQAKEIAEFGLNLSWIAENIVAEFYWIKATALFAFNNNAEALHAIRAALQKNPWSGSYLALEMRLIKPEDESVNYDVETLPQEFEDALLAGSDKVFDSQIKRWLEIGNRMLTRGYTEYAYNVARFMLLVALNDERCMDFFVRAAGSMNSRQSVQHVLLLLQVESKQKITLAKLSACAAKIYALDNDWDLCEEWIDISMKSGLDEKHEKAKLFEIQAISLTIKGKNLKKALNLLEAALDVFESDKTTTSESHLLHAFLLASQGDKKRALEKIEIHLQNDSSLFGLYFAFKTLAWCEMEDKTTKTIVALLLEKIPNNRFEKKLLEDIFCIAGNRMPRTVVAIAS